MNPIPKERREAVIAKIAQPNPPSIAQLAEEEKISRATLYSWKKVARAEGKIMPPGNDSPEGWNAKDKFNAVIETIALNEHQTAEYCRRNGLYPQQIKRWREACENANNFDAEDNKRLRKEKRKSDAQIRKLKAEIERKNKVVAETTALLVLRKKVEAIWGEEGA